MMDTATLMKQAGHAMTHPHRIEITLTEDDFVNSACFAQFRLATTQKALRQLQIWVAVVLFGVAILILRPFEKNWLTTENLIIAGIVLVPFSILALCAPRLQRDAIRKNIRKSFRETISDRFDKPLVMELRDDGIALQNFRGQLSFHYSTVGEILGQENAVYVFLDKANHVFLPRDRIPAETLDAFLDELKTRMARAKETKVDISHD